MKRLFFMVLASILISTSIPAMASASSGSAIVSEAQKYIGAPYSYGGTTSSGFDCSGFTQKAFSDAGTSIPRTTGGQYNTGTSVDKGSLQAGDLVFFNTSGNGVSHAGIYIGSSNFIHSSSSKGVMISSINDPYYWGSRYIGARRVVGQPAAPATPKTEKAPEQKVEQKKVEPKVEAKVEPKIESKPVQKAVEPAKPKAEPKVATVAPVTVPVPAAPVTAPVETTKVEEVATVTEDETLDTDSEVLALDHEYLHLHPTAIDSNLILLARQDQDLIALLKVAI